MTQPLDEFLVAYEEDDNEWWRLGSGDHQNLFEAAVERMEEVERQLANQTAVGEDFAKVIGQLHQRIVEVNDLGMRAARLVASMLHDAGRSLTGGFEEINEVLLEARQRGWLE